MARWCGYLKAQNRIRLRTISAGRHSSSPTVVPTFPEPGSRSSQEAVRAEPFRNLVRPDRRCRTNTIQSWIARIQNVHRPAYLDGRDAKASEKTRFGHSVARYEDDALLIETTQLLGNTSSSAGNILSDQTTTLERYERADDEQHAALQMTLTVTDPAHLEETWESKWRKLQTHDYEFAETECQLPVLSSAI